MARPAKSNAETNPQAQQPPAPEAPAHEAEPKQPIVASDGQPLTPPPSPEHASEPQAPPAAELATQQPPAPEAGQAVTVYPQRTYQDQGELKRRGGKGYGVTRNHAQALVARGLATYQPANP